MLILADDLSGAADTGVAFAMRGLRTVLRLKGGADMGKPAITVISSDSRNLPVAAAIARVRAGLADVNLPMSVPVYKKIDSVLRGHVAAEFMATLETLGLDRAVIAPAFPAQGRITRGGQQIVLGQVVAVGLDVALRSRTSLPMRILALQQERVDLALLREWLTQPGIVVADAETDQHLDQIAAAAQQANVRLCCGSAGLAHALARALGGDGVMQVNPSETGPALIVAGSYHPITRRQLDCLRAHNVVTVALDENAARQCAAALQAGRSVALTLPDRPFDGQMSAALAQALGEAARHVIGMTKLRPKLVLTGGDTALAVCTALGVAAIELQHELEPGVPVGRLMGGLADGVMVVTKSGGFGDMETLWRTI